MSKPINVGMFSVGLTVLTVLTYLYSMAGQVSAQKPTLDQKPNQPEPGKPDLRFKYVGPPTASDWIYKVRFLPLKGVPRTDIAIEDLLNEMAKQGWDYDSETTSITADGKDAKLLIFRHNRRMLP